VIFCIITAGGFTGESTMMFPVFIGIPLGIIIYGLIFGFVFRSLRKTGFYPRVPGAADTHHERKFNLSRYWTSVILI
jgi:hypothetical protein